VAQLARYVSNLATGGQAGEGTEEHEVFERYCAVCHGRTATGNPVIGAPNLTDRVWIYGGSNDALTNTIANGRNGVMPPFQKRLDDTQVRLLVAWLLHNSEP
jgi:cytochrome c oxidase cbb3-type subunit 3